MHLFQYYLSDTVNILGVSVLIHRAAAFVSMWTGLPLRSDTAECEGSFKSTMLEKKDSFVLRGLGTVSPS